jgi:hypothetical protein
MLPQSRRSGRLGVLSGDGEPPGPPIRVDLYDDLGGRNAHHALVLSAQRYFTRHSTFSNIITICSATETWAVSAPAAALSSLGRNMLPSRFPACLFRQMSEQRAHVGERDQIHDIGDGQRPGQGT